MHDRGARGRLIVFEGVDGCGKSTQAARLAGDLGAVLTREPGGTALGARLREVLLDPSTGDVDARAEALLMAADRAQHVAEIVMPTLLDGRHVVSDRYIGSSIAYQGHGRGLAIDVLRSISMWAVQGITPDLVILLDLSAEVASARVGDERDRFELEDDGFRDRVRAGFVAQAEADPGTWAVVDGDGAVEEVAARVIDVVVRRLELPG